MLQCLEDEKELPFIFLDQSTFQGFDVFFFIHFQSVYSVLLFDTSVKYKLTLFHRFIKRKHDINNTLFHG